MIDRGIFSIVTTLEDLCFSTQAGLVAVYRWNNWLQKAPWNHLVPTSNNEALRNDGLLHYPDPLLPRTPEETAKLAQNTPREPKNARLSTKRRSRHTTPTPYSLTTRPMTDTPHQLKGGGAFLARLSQSHDG
jgi:hypothetical protein